MFAAFLHGRVMRVGVGRKTVSSPRPVNGGAPQGSCAGVQMYTVGINDVDSGLEDPQALGSPTGASVRPDFLSSGDESTSKLSLIHI